MRVFLYFFAVSLLMICILTVPVFAQKCEAEYETITALRKPIAGSYNQWDAVYGVMEHVERFVSGVLSADDNNVVVAGELRAQEGADPDLILAEFDRRGRVVWEIVHKIKRIEHVKEILILDKGYLVVADQKKKRKGTQIWLGFFDLKGRLSHEQVIGESAYSLSVGDLSKAQEGSGFVMVAAAHGRGGQSSGQTIFYRLNKKGAVISHRVYLPGVETEAYNIADLRHGSYLLSGYIRIEDGRKAGWVMKIEGDGRVAWQRQYSRGLFAKIIKAQDYIDDYIVTIGDAEPSDRQNRATWVMLLNEENGDIGWQRYYKGGFDYYARDIIAHDDGQISLLIDARNPPKQENAEYGRVLTLSPRGVILLSNSYYNGRGGYAVDMLLGPNQERILVGSSRIAHVIENENDPDDTRVELSLEGWVVAGAPVEPYDDPCVQAYSFLP